VQPPLYTLIVTYLLRQWGPTRDKLLPCIEGDSAESAECDTYTADFDTHVICSLRKISSSLRLADLTDFLWSVPGFEAYCTALEDAAREDADSDAHEVSDLYERDGDHACSLSDADAEVEDDSVEVVLDDQIDECDDGWSRLETSSRDPEEEDDV